MANGRSNFGFNVTGGGGGLASLVQTPQVTPARVGQFAPTPQRRIQRDEKDPQKQILGALLGAASPFLAEAGLGALARIPGVRDRLFKPEADIQEELGIADPLTGRDTGLLDKAGKPRQFVIRAIEDYNKGKPLTDDQYEALEDGDLLDKLRVGEVIREGFADPMAVEEEKLRRRVERAYPRTKAPEDKTMLGKALTELLTYTPAFALGDEDDGSVAAFISAAGAGRKLRSATEDVRLKNYLERSLERSKALVDVGKFTRKTVNGAVLQDDLTFAPFKREALISPDGTTVYLKSQGDPEVDIAYDTEGNKHRVSRPGQYYINSIHSTSDDDPGQPSAVKMMNIGADGAPTIATAYSQFSQTPEGRQVRLGIYDSREGGKFTSIVDLQNKYGDKWVKYDGQEFEALRRAARETADDDLVKEYQGREEKELALIEVANVATDLLDITIRAEKEPQLVTTAGALGEWYNSFTNNVNALYNLFNQGGDFISVNDVVFAKQNGRSALTLGRLLKASNAYSQTIGQTTAQAQADEDELVNALIAVRDAGAEQGALGEWLNLDNDGLKKLVRDRGALVSGQLRLAYAAAAADGQTGTSLSDKDVANFLAQVGFGSQEATDIGAKISKFVKERLQTFDTGKFRALSNQARRHEQRDIDATNNVLISTFRVPESDLTALAEVEVGSDEERRLVNKIDRQIQRISGGSAGHEFIYDSVNKRYRYKPVLERFQKYPRVNRKYMEKYFPHYGITEAEINLDYLEDDDETTQSRASNRTYTPRAIVQ